MIFDKITLNDFFTQMANRDKVIKNEMPTVRIFHCSKCSKNIYIQAEPIYEIMNFKFCKKCYKEVTKKEETK